MNNERSIDVRCDRVENDGKYYYIPSDLSVLKNFVEPTFEIKPANDSTIDSFVEAIFAPRGTYELKKPETKPEPEKPSVEPVKEKSGSDDKWLIYWYVCGTDIESGTPNNLGTNRDMPGHMTRCIKEVEAAGLSDDKIHIFVQAGGASKWHHPAFEANNGKVGRYLYGKDNRNWQPVESLVPISDDPKTHMNTPDSLIAFLEYGKNVIEPKVKPDHRVFIFADHGGGSLSGVCADEYSGWNVLDLKDMQYAFKKVWGSSNNNPPFELIAFDTCLTSTYETAVSLEGLARYMVASQESMISRVMFDYTGLLNGLSANPAMNGAELGKIICDTCLQDAQRWSKITPNINAESILTMSVVDMSKMPTLKAAYERFGEAALDCAKKNPIQFISRLRNAAFASENYSNDFSQNNLTYMVDLKELATHVKETPEFADSTNLIAAIDSLIDAIQGENGGNGAVIYQQRGSSLSKGGGLSTFYPYNFSKKIFDYEMLSSEKLAPKSQSDLYKFLLAHSGLISSSTVGSGSSVSATNVQLEANILNSSPAKGSPFDLSDLNGLNVFVDDDEDGKVVRLNLEPEKFDRIANVRSLLFRLGLEKNESGQYDFIALALGYDTDVMSERKSGKYVTSEPIDDEFMESLLLLGMGGLLTTEQVYALFEDQILKSGEFVECKSSFNGKWLTIDGNPVLVYVISESTTVDENGNKSGSELYSVPIILNDREGNLLISCDYPDETFSVVGMRTELNAGIPTGEIYGITEGDVIKPLYFGIKTSGEPTEEQIAELEVLEEKMKSLQWEDEATRQAILRRASSLEYMNMGFVPGNSFTVGDTLKIEKGSLPDGHYAYAFEFVNPIDGIWNARSDMSAVFTVKNGDIVAITDIDDLEEEEFTELLLGHIDPQQLKD